MHYKFIAILKTEIDNTSLELISLMPDNFPASKRKISKKIDEETYLVNGKIETLFVNVFSIPDLGTSFSKSLH